MSDVKGSAVLLVVAAAMMIFLIGCETTKHSETMSAEQLRALEQASRQSSTSSKDAERGGVDQNLAEAQARSDSSSQGTVPSSELSPEKPPLPSLPTLPTLREVIDADDLKASSGVDLGSSSQGEQFARSLTPLDEFNSGGRGSGSGATDEEVVRLPDLTDAGESMKPLENGELRNGALRKGELNGMDIELSHVYFAFDQFLIRKNAARTLQGNAQILNSKYPNSNVLVEGHCDERGTSDYNLVLGERRAQAVKSYLMDLGVSRSRIQIISYGKERPSCTESEESCWRKNRRGHFVLQ